MLHLYPRLDLGGVLSKKGCLTAGAFQLGFLAPPSCDSRFLHQVEVFLYEKS